MDEYTKCPKCQQKSLVDLMCLACGYIDGWWCEHCQKVVPSEDVTYEETHDQRKGGCGYSVKENPQAGEPCGAA